MSGILNSKQRIMDTVITDEGRRQLASGQMKVAFVSFSDSSTFYEFDAVSGSSDASNRLYFETGSQQQDRITQEADDSGKLVSRNNNKISIVNGQVYSGSSGLIAGNSSFASTSATLLSSSIDNFTNLYLLGTRNDLFDEDWAISSNRISFNVKSESPVSRDKHVQSLNDLPSVFADPHLSHLPNFQFLPPINRVTDNTLTITPSVLKQFKLGSYERLQTGTLNTQDVLEDLETLDRKGYVKVIRFDGISGPNNLAIQVFESSGNELSKLDVIDFGSSQTADSNGRTKRILFVGKVFEDDFETHTFVKIFTLVLE